MSTGIGVNVSKANAYVVLEKPLALNVSKAVAYAILTAINSNPPAWPVMSFVGGIVGVAYSEDFDLGGSTPSCNVAVSSGALPPGMTLTQTGAAAFRVSGVPNLDGTYNFTLTASNAYGSKSKSFSIQIITTSGQVADAFG